MVSTGSRGAGGLTPAQMRLLSPVLSGLAGEEGPLRVASDVALRPGVHRLVVQGSRSRRHVVVKRLGSNRSDLERRLLSRWLPGAGLPGLGPPFLAAVAEPDGSRVWHVYDDLGDSGLDRDEVDVARVLLAMERLADLHAAFLGHRLLPEVRFAAGDLGSYFYARSVRDAVRCLTRLGAGGRELSAQDRKTRDEVLHLLTALLDDEPARVGLLEERAGPESLLHGDLTRENVLVGAAGATPQVRFIDWDHVGVGPVAFDLSTHVVGYHGHLRRLVLDSYVSALADRGVTWAPATDWDRLVATLEAGRLANQVIWITNRILEGDPWGFRALADWGGALAAVLCGDGADRQAAAP